jgi:iron complex outermembrane receptor protein
MVCKIFAILVSGAAVLLTTTAVRADNGTASSVGNNDSSLAEIVVTAEKREQRLIDVPVPVTALSASELLDDNKTRMEDYFRDVPGLTMTTAGSGQSTLSVRGVSTGNTTNPTVGITIDDVPYGSASGLEFGSLISPPDLDPTDLQQIEVLRGPQGTLYGASSLGGLLKFVTADPSFDRISGRVETDGNLIENGGDGGSVRGAINLPLISDTLAMRVSAFERHDGGFIDDPTHGLRDVDSGDAYGSHAALLWKIDDGATLKLSALYQDTKTDGQSAVDTNDRLTPTYGDLDQNRPPGTGTSTIKAQLYSANLTVDLPYALKLVSVSGYAINDYISLLDITPELGAYTTGGGAGLYYDYFTKRFSQEIRLQQNSQFLDWVVGAFYSRERSGDHDTVDDLDFDTGQLINDGLLDENDFFHYDEYAGFASATLHLTPAFDVQGGLRYARNTQFYQTDLQGPLGGGYLFRQSSADHALTYSVAPSYKISEDVLAYVRVASGYRPGGPNAGVFGAGTPRTYNADTTVNYEIGLKGEMFDKRLTIDASVFYVDWTNIQLGSVDPTTGFLYFQNGKSASSKGIELSAKARPWVQATVTASTTVGKAELTQTLPVTAAYAQAGDRLPNDPEVTFSLDFEQTFAINQALNAFAGGSFNYVGSRVGPFVNTAPEVRAPMPAYTLGGLRGGVRTTTGWTVSAYVSNLGNSRGVLSAQTRADTSLPTDPFSATVLQPRTVGISVSKSF